MNYQRAEIDNQVGLRRRLFDGPHDTPERDFSLYAEVMFELIRKQEYGKAEQCARDLYELLGTLIEQISEKSKNQEQTPPI